MTATAAVQITAMRPEHADQVLAVYQHGIDEGNAIFETTAPTWQTFDASKLPHHRLVALDDGARVLGWAAEVPVSDRDRLRRRRGALGLRPPRRPGPRASASPC